MDKLHDAMKEVAEKNKDGIKVQGGKHYTQVVTRVEVFRKHLGDEYGIETEVMLGNSGALVKAKITKDNVVYGTGHAFCANFVKEKAIEKTETTAIGRALASFGLSGGEYCSQDELDTYNERYEKPEIKPVDDVEYNMILTAIKEAKTPDDLALAKTNARNAWGRMSEEQQKNITAQVGLSDEVHNKAESS